MRPFPSLCFPMRVVPCCLISSWPVQQCYNDTKVKILWFKPVHSFVTQQQQWALDILLVLLLIITVFSSLAACHSLHVSDLCHLNVFFSTILLSCLATEVSCDCQHGLYHSGKCLCSFLTGQLWSFFFGSNAGGPYFRAGESGPKQEPFGAEVDPGQWLIPPEGSRRDGVGKQERDVLHEIEREREKHTQLNLWVHLSGVSSLSDCPCFAPCIRGF